jgi:hypothetical protein
MSYTGEPPDLEEAAGVFAGLFCCIKDLHVFLGYGKCFWTMGLFSGTATFGKYGWL